MTVPQPVAGLYVPGDRPERFDKAVASGADLVILDLEDAVAPERTAEARAHVVAWLAQRPGITAPIVQVRVNRRNLDDLRALASVDADVTFEVRVPTVEHPDELDDVARALPGRALTVLLESARGIENAAAIAAHPAVTRLAIGESDLASDLGSRSATVIDYARVRALFAARAAGLPAPMMSAFPAIADLDGLRADCLRGRADGWRGRTAIHPSQLAVIRAAFTATDAERAWALEVLERTAAGGVARLANGDMVDAAMVGRARALLA